MNEKEKIDRGSNQGNNVIALDNSGAGSEENEPIDVSKLAQEVSSQSTRQIPKQDNPDENDMLIVTDYDDTVWVGTAYEIFIEMKVVAEAWRRKSISDEEYFNSECKWFSRMSGEKMDANDLSKDLSMAKKTRILYDRIQKAELMDVEVCDRNDIIDGKGYGIDVMV